MVVQVLKKCYDWERSSVEKKSKSKNHLFWRCWEGQTTSLIAFIFAVLVNVGKKIMCLQCGFKSWREARDIDCGYDVILQKRSRHTVVRRTFCFWRFALLFLGLATHYRESWYTVDSATLSKKSLRWLKQQKRAPNSYFLLHLTAANLQVLFTIIHEKTVWIY